MQTVTDQRSLQSFEFRVISVLANELEGRTSLGSEGLSTLSSLGAQGWEIRAMSVDPRLPAARLLVALQRRNG